MTIQVNNSLCALGSPKGVWVCICVSMIYFLLYSFGFRFTTLTIHKQEWFCKDYTQMMSTYTMGCKLLGHKICGGILWWICSLRLLFRVSDTWGKLQHVIHKANLNHQTIPIKFSYNNQWNPPYLFFLLSLKHESAVMVFHVLCNEGLSPFSLS